MCAQYLDSMSSALLLPPHLALQGLLKLHLTLPPSCSHECTVRLSFAKLSGIRTQFHESENTRLSQNPDIVHIFCSSWNDSHEFILTLGDIICGI